jgi:hypothetical protein
MPACRLLLDEWLSSQRISHQTISRHKAKPSPASHLPPNHSPAKTSLLWFSALWHFFDSHPNPSSRRPSFIHNIIDATSDIMGCIDEYGKRGRQTTVIYL